MPRYIDATSFQEKLTEVAREPDYRHEGENWRCGVYLAGTHLDIFPTTDVVEVVRCKDCKDFEPHGNGKAGLCKNKKCNGIRYTNDFCSYGERKD